MPGSRSSRSSRVTKISGRSRPRIQINTGGSVGRSSMSRSTFGNITASVARSEVADIAKRVLNRNTESKYVMFYQTANSGVTTSRAVGDYALRGYATQNNTITTNTNPIIRNNLDILQLIPYCEQGVADNQRLGDKITPKSLTVSGSVRIKSLTRLQEIAPTDIKVVIYVLQHVSLKDYNNLYANNDFSQLLETGENSTVQFEGQSWHAKMPIAKQYYRLLKKKIITLRYAGAENTSSTVVPYSVANSHNYFAEYKFSLSKHLPANLKYPENSVLDPNVLNAPTNSSIFMCMGFYDQKESYNGSDLVTEAWMEQTYVSKLVYKDL